LLTLSLAEASAGGEPKTLTVPASGGARDLSPDGRLIAFESPETGRDEIWVTPFPGPGPRLLVSTEGGVSPRWNPNGRELLYRDGTKLMSVAIEIAPALRAGRPKLLFESPDTVPAIGSQRIMSYDVSSDGQRFLLIKPEATAAQSNSVQVIVNWADELARRAPLK
jgi:dipeptidyl aminopeptidase/acylaminoacyl peptidase